MNHDQLWDATGHRGSSCKNKTLAARQIEWKEDPSYPPDASLCCHDKGTETKDWLETHFHLGPYTQHTQTYTHTHTQASKYACTHFLYLSHTRGWSLKVWYLGAETYMKHGSLQTIKEVNSYVTDQNCFPNDTNSAQNEWLQCMDIYYCPTL